MSAGEIAVTRVHVSPQEIILKVNINCSSSSCPRKLKKYLTELSGVYTVVIDPEKYLVTVRGKVDPVMVLNAIRETGHSAELFSYQKEPKVEDEEKWYGKGKGKEHGQLRGQRTGSGREKRKQCHHSGKHHHDHEIEDHIPPEIDPEICRDPLCRHHRRRPIIITNRVTTPWERADHLLHHHHSYLENPFDYLHRPRLPPPCALHFGGAYA